MDAVLKALLEETERALSVECNPRFGPLIEDLRTLFEQERALDRYQLSKIQPNKGEQTK